eukprot:6978883-Pyramimonas_sp.AAC.1
MQGAQRGSIQKQEQNKAERAIAEQARQALRGAQDREARLEDGIRLKLREAMAFHEQLVSKAEQVAVKSVAERRHLEEKAVDAQETAA